MKYNFQLGIIIGIIFAILLPNACILIANNHLKNTIIRKDDEIISLHKELDSMQKVNHKYEIDWNRKIAALEIQQALIDTFEIDTTVYDTIPDSLEMP